MNNKRLTLEQATKYYLKGFILAVKQIDYLDSSNHKEINDIIEMVSNRISEDYKNVFANSKKSTIYPTIKIGSRGASVKTLQTLLNSNGANLTVDGIFGQLTKIAVLSFQGEKGLTKDGIVGKLTWAKLLKQ